MDYGQKFSGLAKKISGKTDKKFSKDSFKKVIKEASAVEPKIVTAELDGPAIYVASLSDYNNGRLAGKWFELKNYTHVDELYADIEAMLKSIGPDREEWAIHDYQGFPSSLYSEYMDRNKLQMAIDFANLSDEIHTPTEVFAKWMSDSGMDYSDMHDAIEKFRDCFMGEFDKPEDYAYDVASERASSMENPGYMNEYQKKSYQQALHFMANYLYMDDTSAREFAINMSNGDELPEEDHYNQIEDYERRIKDDAVEFLTGELGYDIPSLLNSAFKGGDPYMSFDSEKYWRDMTYEGYEAIYSNGKYYIFCPEG